MTFIEIKESREITFKGLENNYLICDIEWAKAKRVKRMVDVDGELKLKTVTDHPLEKGAKIKLDISNPELLEKANLLVDGDIITISYRIPANVDQYDTDTWEIIDILDDIDLLEISNKHCLIPDEIPKKENKIQPKRTAKKKNKKDIKIAELEQENAQLRLRIQVLEQQLNNNAISNL